MEKTLSILKQYKGFSEQAFLQLCEDTDFNTAFQILQRFNDNLKQGVSSLEMAIKTSDAETSWKTCHKIAGSAELLGFMSFGNKCRNLSHQIKANPHTPVFASELSVLIAEINEHIYLIDKCEMGLSAKAF